MDSEPQILELRLASTLKSLERAELVTAEVCASAGFEEEDCHRIEMAVHETMVNAIRHGNKEDSSKHVRVTFKTFSDRIEIQILDQGPGFEPAQLPDPLDSRNLLKTSGRGILVARSFVDEFLVQRIEGDGTEVTLVKRKTQP